MHTTSPTLLERLRGRTDVEAWNWFVDLYTPLLFKWANRCCRDDAEAADLVQETLVTLLQTLPHFDRQRKGSFRRWLQVLLVNKQRDYYRRHQLHQQALAKMPLEEATPDAITELSEAEYQHELSRRALRLMQAEFEPATWQACWETLVEGRSAADVGTQLGLTENAVYIAKCRVVRRLRECLAELLE